MLDGGEMKKRRKIAMRSAITLIVLSVIFTGLALFEDIATGKAFRNRFINPDGTWTNRRVDWTDEMSRENIAESVGAEIRILRANWAIINQSNMWLSLAAVSGVAAAIIATVAMNSENKASERTH